MPSSLVTVRCWSHDDIPALIECHRVAYPDFPAASHFGTRIHQQQLEAFPEGQFLAEIDDRIVGYATLLIVRFEQAQCGHTWNEITGRGTFCTHDPDGDTLYGADIAVHPDFRGQGIAGQLYLARKRLLKHRNLRRMIAYGRIPGYAAYAERLTPDEYVKAVEHGALSDPALNAHRKAGYTVARVLSDCVRDRSSCDYCTLLEMPNPDYRPRVRPA